MGTRSARSELGATLLEMLFAVAVMATAAAISVPFMSSTIDDVRTGLAARYVAGRVSSARMDAVRRLKASALRFEPAAGDYVFAGYADGNGNGVRSAEIHQGIDPVLGPFERLRDRFPDVRFELMAGVPDADGQAGTGTDGVRIGNARLLSMSSDGTATSGTLYIRGRRRQYAVRVLGVTGRTRVLQVLSRRSHMDRPLVDRRLDTRFGQPAIAGTQAILRPGYAVSLIDLSSGGALIQGPRPLRPGARVHLQLMNGTRRLAIGAHVLRCSVAALDAREGVQYRGALKFDHRCEILWEEDTRDGYLFPADERAFTPAGGHDLPGHLSEPDRRDDRSHK